MMPKLCAVGLLTAFLSIFLGEMGFKSRKLLSILSILLLFGGMSEGLGLFLDKIIGLAETAGISEACRCALKAVGLGYVFGFTSDVCTELGEHGVSKAVSLVGKVEILLVSVTYFEETVELGIRLLK